MEKVISPVGVLDSGVGGVYVLRQAARLMPRENFLFYGDLGHAPYGSRPTEEIRKISMDAARYLVDQDRPEEARREYARLVEKYPDSRYAPESQLMVAQLWASSHTRGDNNLVNLSNAREAYEEFTLRFPSHPDAGKAMNEALNMDRLMVQQQLEVGRYYLERSREYTSAIFCLEDVIRQKEINPEAAKEAESLLSKARAAAETAQIES